MISFVVGNANYSTGANNSVVVPVGDIEKTETVNGTISVVIEDDFERNTSKTLYYIKIGNEQLSVYFTGEKPNLASGDKVSIKNAVRTGAKIIVPAPTNIYLLTYSKPLSSQQTIRQKKAAVILFNLQDNIIEPFTREETRKKVYDEADNYYQEISFNQLNITGHNSPDGEQDIYGWYTIPADSSSNCDYSLWANMAEEAAVENDNFNRNYYSNIMYFFPKNYNCEWGGLAILGPLNSDKGIFKSWYNGNTQLVVITHELGHNFGAIHASNYACYDENKNRVPISNDCDWSEYGDKFDVMGTGSANRDAPYHMSSFHKTQMNWFDAPNIQTVEKDGIFTLFPIEKKSSNIQTIRIPRGTYLESANYDDYYFLEYRRPYGYDSFKESDTVANGISIRLVKAYNIISASANRPYLIDNTPKSYYDDWEDSALLTGKIFKDDIANIEIKTISVSAESAVVEIKTSYVKPCDRKNPSISISPPQQSVLVGDTAQYTITLVNNDNPQNCESSVFNITPTLPMNLSQSPSSFKMTLSPSETKAQIITIATNAIYIGVYEFTETAINESAVAYWQSAKAQITTIPKPVYKTLTIKRKGNGFGKIIIINNSDNKKKTICDLSSGSNNKCEYQYLEKSKLKLWAQNSSNSLFRGWIGGCFGTSKTCNITLSSDKIVQAVFAIKNKK